MEKEGKETPLERKGLVLGKRGGPSNAVLDLVSCCGGDVEKRCRLESMLAENPQRCVVSRRAPLRLGSMLRDGRVDADASTFSKMIVSAPPPLYPALSSKILTDALEPDQPILYVDRMFECWTGYTNAVEFLGKNWCAPCSPERQLRLILPRLPE